MCVPTSEHCELPWKGPDYALVWCRITPPDCFIEHSGFSILSILSILPILSYLILSYLILSYLLLSYLILSIYLSIHPSVHVCLSVSLCLYIYVQLYTHRRMHLTGRLSSQRASWSTKPRFQARCRQRVEEVAVWWTWDELRGWVNKVTIWPGGLNWLNHPFTSYDKWVSCGYQPWPITK